MERTFAIIKPDATARQLSGKILQRIEEAGFRIRAMKTMRLTPSEAEGFYAVHRERPFFKGLTEYMSSGPIVAIVLEAPDAIQKWRTLMGATDPAKAAAGTIRKDFAENVERNAVHGSDSPESAATEIPYFFSALELVG
jgi:nucleoside-diphosphate kinase